MKTIELLRQKELVKHSLETGVIITMESSEIKKVLSEIEAEGIQTAEQFLKELCIISSCEIRTNEIEEIEIDNNIEDDTESDEDGYIEQEFDDCVEYIDTKVGFAVKAAHAQGNKCPRCWQWEVTHHQDGLCNRCHLIVGNSIN